MWIPIKLVWSIQFSFFIRLKFFLELFSDLTCWFHYLMKWFLFSMSWFYDISLNFQSCLAFLSWLFARFLSLFVLSSIIINRFWSDFWCFLSFFFVFLLRILFYDPQIDAAHSNCHLWLINLSWFFVDRFIFSFFLWSFELAFEKFLKVFFLCRQWKKFIVNLSMERKIQVFVMRKVWYLICSKCMMLYVMWKASDYCYELMNQLPRHWISVISYRHFHHRLERKTFTNW